VAAAIVALSALFAPVASAQVSYSLITGVPNPFCLITGPNNAGCGTQVNYVATAPFTTGSLDIGKTWSAESILIEAKMCYGLTGLR
jgi:hypothetical protein